MGIKENVKSFLDELPKGVLLVAATKSRTPEEILQAVDAGLPRMQRKRQTLLVIRLNTILLDTFRETR